jgi:hypothetical protein
MRPAFALQFLSPVRHQSTCSPLARNSAAAERMVEKTNKDDYQNY